MDSPDSDSSATVSELPQRRREEDEEEEAGRKRGLWLAIPLIMVAGAVVAVVMFGLRDKGIYAKPLDELVQEREKFAGRPVRAEGILVPGTLVKRDQPCEYRFTIERGDVQVPVRFPQCVIPDTFRDVEGTEVAVTVEGKLQADGSFEASNVLAKCPSKYEMKERQSRGEAMPHGPAAAPQM